MTTSHPASKITTFRLDPAIHKLLTDYAIATRRSMNAALNTILEKSLNEWIESGNDNE